MKQDARKLLSAILSNAYLLSAVTFLIYLANIVSRYPGRGNYDTEVQYKEVLAHDYTDRHPPVMAFVWRYLDHIVQGMGSLFVIQLTLYWLGFFLIARVFQRKKSIIGTWLIITLAIWPPFLMMNIRVITDVALATCFLYFFAVGFWYRAQNMRLRPWAIAPALCFLAYGILVRANGVFGAPPLLLYAFCPHLIARPIRVVIISAIMAIALVPASNFINHDLIGARQLHPFDFLLAFDVAGIAIHSHDMSFYQERSKDYNLLQKCYTPVYWDTMSRNDCPVFMADHFAGSPTDTWMHAIAKHPMAYLEHRYDHFAREMTAKLDVNAISHGPEFSGTQEPDTLRGKLTDAVRYNILMCPLTSFIIATIAFLFAFKPARCMTPEIEAANYLFFSGFFYMAAYFIAGVASEYRYQLWGIMSVCIATSIYLVNILRQRKQKKI